MSDLPAFPVDDLTLDAIDHALGAMLTYDRPDDAELDDLGPWVIGAEFSLPRLLDFLGGTMGEDPNAEEIDPGREVDPGAPMWEQIAAARVVVDSRTHYSEHDLTGALVAEIRRLRETSQRVGALRDNWARLAGEAMDPECREWLSAASKSLAAALTTPPAADPSARVEGGA